MSSDHLARDGQHPQRRRQGRDSPKNDTHRLLGESLGKLYEQRVKNNQDLIILIDDQHNRRGTGKTVLSILLAHVMDRTEEGMTEEKAHINPEGLIQAYRNQPKGAGLVLDEAEVGMDKYRASSASNVALRRLVSMGRVREKYVVINVPNTGQLDRDLKALADVWIMVRSKGRAKVHFLGWQPYQEHPLTPDKHDLHWRGISDPQLQRVYDSLADEKDAYLDGETADSMFIDRKQHAKELDQRERETREEVRNEIIRELAQDPNLSQSDIAEKVGISQPQVSRIVSD